MPQSPGWVRWFGWLACLAALLSAGCAGAANCDQRTSPQDCLRVLFIGNSYTYTNDLPGVFAHLAAAGKHAVETAQAAQGGWTLAEHAASAETLKTLQAKQWDYVVLQEQSQLPASVSYRAQAMYPAAAALAQQIRANGSQPILFDTWAHQDGWPEENQNDYSAMQNEINRGYLEAAKQIDAPLALVGYAWAAVHQQHPEIQLWQADGSHPSESGTYLAACVFYALFFKENPVGLGTTGSLKSPEAKILQQAAAFTVLGIKP